MFKSKSPPPRVVVEFDEIYQRNYCTGENIKGSVKISTLDLCNVDSLRVFLSGVEECFTGSHPKQTPLVPSNPVVLCEKSRLEEGEYQYPFEFAIPIHLEPSVIVPGSFVTSYTLHTELRVTKYTSKPFEDKFDIYLHKPATQLVAPTFNEKMQRGLIHKEKIVFKCLPSSGTIQLYQPIEFDITIHNNTKKEISRMVISLEQQVTKGKKKKPEFSTIYQMAEKLGLASQEEYSTVSVFKVDERKGLVIPSTYSGVRVTVEYFILFVLEYEGGGTWTCKMPTAVRGDLFEEKSQSKLHPIEKRKSAEPESKLQEIDKVQSKLNEPESPIIAFAKKPLPVPNAAASSQPIISNGNMTPPPSYNCNSAIDLHKGDF